MTPIYNQYLKPIRDEQYVSEIVFINTDKPIVNHKLFYVAFDDSLNKPSGLFYDNNNYLKKIFYEVRKDNNSDKEIIHLKHSNNIISSIQPAVKNYSYIKVITDSRHPQLEGQIMIFSFGQKILDKLIEYLNSEKIFNNIFKLKIEIMSGYPNYDRSYFTDKELNITDLNLNLDSEIFFKQINILQIEREEKLKKLTSDIELRNERYQEYLKLKEEFENE